MLARAGEVAAEIHVDLTRLGFIDLVGLRLLVRTAAALPTGRLVLFSSTPMIGKLLHLTGWNHRPELVVQEVSDARLEGAPALAQPAAFVHRALYYTSAEEFLNAAAVFIAEAANDEAVYVAVGRDHADQLRDRLAPGHAVSFVADSEWFRQPAAALGAARARASLPDVRPGVRTGRPAVRRFAPAQPVR